MTEQRPTYLPLTWQVTASFHVHTGSGKTREYSGYTWQYKARDALEATEKALREIRRIVPKFATVFNLSLVVSLMEPEQNQESDLTADS